jgi:deazaflavin-dependent oxidoreductase (nitroreductase family)
MTAHVPRADTDAVGATACEPGQMTSDYRLTAPRRLLNLLMRALLRLGIAPPHNYLLTTRGRRTGVQRSTPVTLIDRPEGRWLVAPYGSVGWVQNARAAGHVRLSRGRNAEDLRVDEVCAQDAAPILQAYVRKVRIVRPYFDAAPDDPLEAFVAEASRHPVFRLQR